MKRYPLPMLLLALTGCNRPTWSADERAAIDACLNAATAASPEIEPNESGGDVAVQMDDIDQAKFAKNAAGEFAFHYPNVRPTPPDAFVCEGSLTNRRIRRVLSNGQINQGPDLAGWSY